MNQRLLDELFEWLRIPSISSGGGDLGDLERAAQWVCSKIADAGGEAEVVPTAGNPLAVGRLTSRRPDAPTVLVYGHYDVQSADPVDAWTSPPFEPEIRDGRIYARGACDDKGNLWPLVFVACELAQSGDLPVNVRFLIEGEEEIGSKNVGKWLEQNRDIADCAVVFDSLMLDERTPAITLGVRGMVTCTVTVKTAPGDLHSGLYGGTVRNAVHVLWELLQTVIPGPDGLLRDELRRGIIEPSPEELEQWERLPSGGDVIQQAGGHPLSPEVARDYYRRNWAEASLDINGIAGGDAVQTRTIIPAHAQAKLSMRLAPGQDKKEMADALMRLLHRERPRHIGGVSVAIGASADPALFDGSSKPMELARRALERACGVPPVFVRSGGSIPILAAFAERGIPTVLTGFALPGDAFHAPDESYRLESLELGERSARALYEDLAQLR